jgi:hypothetical protein
MRPRAAKQIDIRGTEDYDWLRLSAEGVVGISDDACAPVRWFAAAGRPNSSGADKE